MPGASALDFHVSHVRVELDCDIPEVLRGMGAVWGSCSAPLMPTTRVARFGVRERAGTFEICQEDRSAESAGGTDPWSARADRAAATLRTARREDVLPLLEGALYAAISEWHRGAVLLHAACLWVDGAPVVLAGRSGGGKSSLSLAALREGCGYQGDELAVTDGAHVWGVPRAVQFNACLDGAGLPPWVCDLDTTSYRLRIAADTLGCVPLFQPPTHLLRAAPFPAHDVRLVFVEYGEVAAPARLEPITPLDALGLLHEACFEPPHLALGALVHPARIGRLRWSHPAEALASLRAWVASAERASR